eukprot:Transcript_1354.p1 GENE.Transcript_1354~~Transcript_1354.p1  ORF type:complete len:309 (+),score=12.91 Transcript_1354:95-1021(+)
MGSAASTGRLAPPKDPGRRQDPSSILGGASMAKVQTDPVPEVGKQSQRASRSRSNFPHNLQVDAAEAHVLSPTPLRRRESIDTTGIMNDPDRTPSPLVHHRQLGHAQRRRTAPSQLQGDDVNPTPPLETVRRRFSPDGDVRREVIQVTPRADTIEALLGRDLLRRMALLNSFSPPRQQRGQDQAAIGINHRNDSAENQSDHDKYDTSIVLYAGGSKHRCLPAARNGGSEVGEQLATDDFVPEEEEEGPVTQGDHLMAARLRRQCVGTPAAAATTFTTTGAPAAPAPMASWSYRTRSGQQRVVRPASAA